MHAENTMNILYKKRTSEYGHVDWPQSLMSFLLCLFVFLFFTSHDIGTGLPGLIRTSTKLGLMCLAQDHNTVTPVRLEPAAPRTRVKHSTTEHCAPSFFVVKLIISDNLYKPRSYAQYSSRSKYTPGV